MSNDILFSGLPRRGTIPVNSARGEVKPVAKKTPAHGSPDEENTPKIKEKQHDCKDEANDKEPHSKDYSDEHRGLIVDTTDEFVIDNDSDQTTTESSEKYSAKGKEEKDESDKGKNLDISI